MANLTLEFEGLVLNEYVVGPVLRIGRLPDNTVIIDNPAVSSHHARIVRDGDHFVLEDLQSTNGTFVNETRVTRQTLQHGDVVLVGKHKLVFDRGSGDEPAVADEVEPMLSNQGDTVFLDTKKHRALVAKLEEAQARAGNGAGPAPGIKDDLSLAHGGALRVLGGHADRQEYNLDARTALIGKSETALVRLHGWFKPRAAVAIARTRDGYVATRLGGKPLVNSEPLNKHVLKNGDLLRVSGLTLEFRLKA